MGKENHAQDGHVEAGCAQTPMKNYIKENNLDFNEGKEQIEVQCALCPFKCKNKSKLNQHFSRVHEKEREFKCGDCSSSFSKQNQLTMHIMKYHESKISSPKFVSESLLINGRKNRIPKKISFHARGLVLLIAMIEIYIWPQAVQKSKLRTRKWRLYSR